MNKKKMFMINGYGRVFINSSSADIIQTCRRKAYYSIHMDYRPSSGDSTALSFGSAIHKALEEFYRAGPGERSIDKCVDAFVACASGTKLIELASDDKRSISNGKRIIEKYFSVYRDDPWIAVTDEHGPFVERSFEIAVDSEINIFGQIDCLLKNVETGEIVVCDHKTSSSLGTDFMNRIKPNLQFSTYAWAARQLGWDVKRVMINGIQVAKTKTDLVRVFTERNQEDFNEMMETYNDSIEMMRQARNTNKWPLNSTACSHYGGCQYREVCSLPADQRDNALDVLSGKSVELEQE